ncbi:MAG: hypothetical protein BWK79_09040, partial [Beggiatoa sp. IS2]
MKRKLAITLAWMNILFASDAYALGLSNIAVSSKLNEPFSARISVVSVPKGDMDNIKVSLAPAEAFRRAGIERSYALSGLQFSVSPISKTEATISVSSAQPLKEPFLNFLIEVSWPSGRILREYTALLDPPLYSKTPLPREMRPVVKSPPKAPPAVSESPKGRPPSAASGQPAPKRALAVAKPRPVAPAPEVDEGKGYYPTAKNDTLWSIANRTRPDKVSLMQHIDNIHHANPRAFIGGNMNMLKHGEVLRVPGLTSGINRQEAKQAVAEQRMVATPPKETPKAPDEGTSDGSTKTAMGTGPTVQIDPLNSPGAKTEGNNAPTTPPSGSGSTTELTGLREQNESFRKENDELKSKLATTDGLVSNLQKQIDELNKLIKVQSGQLAELQAGVKNTPKPPVSVPVPPVPPV